MTGVRLAKHHGTCAAPGCRQLIEPGSPIVKPGDGCGWRHADCTRPGRRAGRRKAGR